MIDLHIAGSAVSEAGLRTNVTVGIQYIESWLRGVGAAALYNLMEDVATAEISRSQVWQWIRHGVQLKEGPTITRDLVRRIIDEELAKVRTALGPAVYDSGRFREARALFEQVALGEEFVEFLTIPAYQHLD